VDKLLKDEKTNAVDKSSWAWFKAIMSMVLGAAILSVLAEPLTQSVQNFSEDAGIPSFFVSFVLAPLATNARAATSAITTACRKKSITTSLTFSEVCRWTRLNFSFLFSFQGIMKRKCKHFFLS